MTTESEIYKTAQVVLEKYGEEAEIYAAIRGDEFHRLGNMAGEALWRRITKAVKNLQIAERPKDFALH